jgi:uncharacterized membrane-anchored protein
MAAPGEQLVEWGVPYEEFVAEGTSEDVAMLLAWAGALIIAVGTRAMVEFAKGRKGMASTFSRLRLGPVLVDAKGVNRSTKAASASTCVADRTLVAILVVAIVSRPIHDVRHVAGHLRGPLGTHNPLMGTP